MASPSIARSGGESGASPSDVTAARAESSQPSATPSCDVSACQSAMPVADRDGDGGMEGVSAGAHAATVTGPAPAPEPPPISFSDLKLWPGDGASSARSWPPHAAAAACSASRFGGFGGSGDGRGCGGALPPFNIRLYAAGSGAAMPLSGVAER